AWTFVEALKNAGNPPTRAGLMNALTHLKAKNPFLYPGVSLSTTPTERYPIDQQILEHWQSEAWHPFGFVFKNARQAIDGGEGARRVLATGLWLGADHPERRRPDQVAVACRVLRAEAGPDVPAIGAGSQVPGRAPLRQQRPGGGHAPARA